MTTTTSTKTFTLAQMLSITTGRICCDIGKVYDILNHVTGDEVFPHVIPRAFRFAAPMLLKAHPELQPANACLSNLARWINSDKTESKMEGVKMWLAELKMMFPSMDKPFAVESYADAWLSLDPVSELEGMVSKEKCIVVTPCGGSQERVVRLRGVVAIQSVGSGLLRGGRYEKP